ncbi:MAG: hypothetical protein U1E15_06080 [Hyphomicrobiales bacterium]
MACKVWTGVRPAAVISVVLLFLLQLGLSLLLLSPGLADQEAFRALLAHPQIWGAARLTLFTGLASTALSLVAALVIVQQARPRLAAEAGLFLAVPHLAFALGLSLVIMPSGVLARACALLLNWTTPPGWVTTQDPLGLALAAALVLKETPFVVWAFAGLLNREDLRTQFAGQMAAARSLGHGPHSAFLRIVVPQLLGRSAGAVIAVLVYGLTVVDMALVIGPTQPPTFAQVIWSDLNDADPAHEARGGAGVLLLALGIVLLLASGWLALRLGSPLLRRFLVRPAPVARQGFVAPLLWPLWKIVYTVVLAVLVVTSVAGLWRFPALLPDHLTLAAWQRALADGGPLVTSLWLALATAAAALGLVVLWCEAVPQRLDRLLLWPSLLLLCLPSLVLALGQYRLFLLAGQTGTAVALFLAHLMPVMAYVVIMLIAPYRAHDPRWQASAAGLQATRARFLLRVKWPMLKAPLLSAFAVGFAVSVAQYAPAQLVAAGRFSTLPMEAVTLASGGDRAVAASYGVMLALLPLVVFIGSGLLSRPRWSNV